MCNENKSLLSKEEYISNFSDIDSLVAKEWSDPVYQCEKCGGGMCRNQWEICASLPPKYIYKCNQCGHVDYLHY